MYGAQQQHSYLRPQELTLEQTGALKDVVRDARRDIQMDEERSHHHDNLIRHQHSSQER